MTADEDERIKLALSHILQELELSNIEESLKAGDFEEIRKSHDAIHEFMYLAPHSLPNKKEVTWHQKSAFLTNQWEAFHSAHRAFMEVLAGFYNVGYAILRNTLELLVRGAFWECLAHKRFRVSTKMLDKDVQKYGKGRKSVKDWIEELIKRDSSIEQGLDEISGSIYDITAVLFEEKEFQRKYIRTPSFSLIVNQLIEWEIIDFSNAFQIVYTGLYNKLSKNVHVIPDRTDIGRRFLQEKAPFEIDIMPTELNKFLKDLHEVMDIGIVIELNILSDWIKSDEEVKTRLRERINVLEDLGIKRSFSKLKSLVLT